MIPMNNIIDTEMKLFNIIEKAIKDKHKVNIVNEFNLDDTQNLNNRLVLYVVSLIDEQTLDEYDVDLDLLQILVKHFSGAYSGDTISSYTGRYVDYEYYNDNIDLFRKNKISGFGI